MKRLTAIALAIGLVLLAQTPVSATTVGGQCVTETSTAGGAKVRICEYVSYANGYVWIHADFDPVAGYNQPADIEGFLYLWSYHSGWCDGILPSCSGGGDSQYLVNGSPTLPANRNTQHLAANQHYCSVHGEIKYYVSWPSGGFDDGGFNTLGVDTTHLTGCTTNPPG